MNKPTIVCLCGSTRFTEKMLIKQWELTKQGYIVLSWCALPDSYFGNKDRFHVGDQEGVKELVDEIHKRKIDISDEVLILNIGGYIGESTRSELNYALEKGKRVSFEEEQEEDRPANTVEKVTQGLVKLKDYLILHANGLHRENINVMLMIIKDALNANKP